MDRHEIITVVTVKSAKHHYMSVNKFLLVSQGFYCGTWCCICFS